MSASAPPLLTTKLYVPRARPASRLVSRPRLTARLAEGSAHPLTLISAPAGFGKTTLLTEWLQGATHFQPAPLPRSAALRGTGRYEGASASHLGVAWLSLDESDNDPARFWTYVVAALQTLDPGLGASALPLLQSAQSPPLESILTQLLNDISARLDRFTLVLDDYHVIRTPTIHELVAFLIDHLPSPAHVIITGRADPPLPLARLRARGQLLELRAEDLRFDPEEATAFLNRAMGLALSPDDVSALEERTEGWIAGLQLAALSMRGRDDVHDFVQAFTGSHAYIIDYLVEEVLRRQPADIERFLLQTSILDRLSGPLCDAVTGGTNAQAILEQLERANLFLFPLDNNRKWYRYHHLFAEVLRQRLMQSAFTAGQDRKGVAELHRRASVWYEQHQLMAEAVSHALAAPDFEHAADLVEQSVEAVRKLGEYQTLQTWLEKLPEALLRARPRLSLARGSEYIRAHDLETAEQWVEHAERAVQGAASASRILSEALALRARIAQRRNDFPRVIELAQRSLQLMPEDNQSLWAQVTLTLGNAAFYCDRPDAALWAFAESSRLAEAVGDIHTALNAIVNQGIVQKLNGQLRQAAATYRRGLQLAADHNAERMPMTGALHTNLAAVLHEWNDLEAASAHLREAIDRNDQSKEPYSMMLSRTLLARTLQARGEEAEALRAVQAALRISRESNLLHLSMVEAIASQVQIWIAQRNLAAVADWLQDSGLSVGDALTPVQEPEHLALARALSAHGQFDQALKLLARLRTAAEAVHRTAVQIEILALESVAQAGRGDTLQAQATLERALALAEPEGFMRTFVDEGEPMRQVLADCRGQMERQARTTEGENAQRWLAYIDKLLAAFGQSLKSTEASVVRYQPSAIGELVEPLTDREQEVLRLVAEGLSDRQIAEKMTVVVGTVKRHLNNLYGKLGVHSRTQAMARAKELGLL